MTTEFKNRAFLTGFVSKFFVSCLIIIGTENLVADSQNIGFVHSDLCNLCGDVSGAAGASIIGVSILHWDWG